MTWVVDSSVVIKWFVNEEGHENSLYVLDSGLPIIAPDFALCEVANVLWRNVRKGFIIEEQMVQAIHALPTMFDRLIPSTVLLSKAVQLAKELEHSVYDCLFLAAAEQDVDYKFVSADKKFISKVNNHYGDERVVGLAQILPSVQELRSHYSHLEEAAVRFYETSDGVRDKIIEGKERPFFNVSELKPAFDSPALKNLEILILSRPIYELQCIMAVCWLGQQKDTDFRTHLAHAHARLVKIDDDMNYFISKLQLFKEGIQTLETSNKSQSKIDED